MGWWRGRRPDGEIRAGAGLDELFGPSRKHIHERKEWVAIAKIDDRYSGDDPIVDLTAGVVTVKGDPTADENSGTAAAEDAV